MDVREKLVDIVCDATQINGCIHSCNHPPCAMVRGIVDALIANGVTVQEWISVDDRQPNNKGCYLLTVKHWFDGEPVVREAYWNGKDWFSCDDRRYKITPRVTHWMLLPELPKGANDAESVD